MSKLWIIDLKTFEQRLLVQDGKLYGRDPVFAVITRAAALSDNTRNHDIQKKESIVQLGQVMWIIILVCLVLLLGYDSS